MKKISSVVLSTLTAALLIGCGGGGSESSSSGSNSSSSSSSNKTVGGSVIDGYIKNATVCLDLSLDGVCDNSEPFGKTDENGTYSLIINPTQQNHQNFNVAPLIAFGGTDIDTNADFTGKLQAQVSGTSANVTPLTTILSKLVQDEVSSSTSKIDLEKKISEKKELIRTSFNLPTGTNIDDDFKKSNNQNLEKVALKIQKTVDLISEIGTDGTKENKDLSNEIFKVIADKIKDSSIDVLASTIEEVKTSTTITGFVFDNSEKDNLDLAKKNIDIIIENTSSVQDMLTLIETEKNKIKNNETLTEYTKDTLPNTVDALKVLALENFLKVLGLETSFATSLIEDKIDATNIILKFTDTTQTELHTKYLLIKTAVAKYNQKQEDQSKSKSFAVQAIEILEKINIETDDIDSKIVEAKKKVEGLSENDAIMVQNILDLTKIINSDEVSTILEIKSDSLTESSILSNVVKSTVDETISLTEKYNGIASNSIITMNKMATQLKKISDNINKVFENESYVFEYANERITYEDSLALRGTILAIAFKLDFIASYSWGDDEDIKIKKEIFNSTEYEYQNINVSPDAVFNKGSAFKLTNSSRLEGARAYLIEGLELINKLPSKYENMKEEDKIELTNILNSVKGNGSYEYIEEREEYNWDFEKWKLDNTYEGDVTVFTKKFYIDLSKLLNSSYAIDINSFGSSFQLTCERDKMEFNLNSSIIENDAVCIAKTGVEMNGYIDMANITPTIKPTTSSSKLDDVITKIITEEEQELTGQAVIDYILD